MKGLLYFTLKVKIKDASGPNHYAKTMYKRLGQTSPRILNFGTKRGRVFSFTLWPPLHTSKDLQETNGATTSAYVKMRRKNAIVRQQETLT